MEGNGERPTLSLEELKLLTEVVHIFRARKPGEYDHQNPAAVYDQDVLNGVMDNRVTRVQEDAMSSAVTRSYQSAEEVRDELGQKRRAFIWRGLGRHAVSVAMSGYQYHFSEQAFARVGVEIDEAKHSEENLTPGTAQVFFSPRMSEADDPDGDIAVREHLADEDAIRVGTAVTDENGNVIGRQMESLLVRDIPLSAWVDMVRDPQNIWGKAMEVSDPDSALSIMKLFDQLDLPEDVLSEGPVTLVSEVAKYIKDPEAKYSVLNQLKDFRQDQNKLHEEAQRTANDWQVFDIDLAESIHQNKMQARIYGFVVRHQNQWPDDFLSELKAHEKQDGSYGMSWKFAAKLQQAWHKIHIGGVAVAVGDKRATKDMDQGEVQRLQNNIAYIRMVEASGMASEAQINQLHAQHNREVAASGVRPGGGCNGRNGFNFSDSGGEGQEGVSDGIPREKSSDELQDDNEEGGNKLGKVKKGYCRIPGCSYQKVKTDVGGCDVCLKSCQPLFDAGLDSDQIEAIYANSVVAEESHSDKPKTPSLVGVE